MVKPLKTSFLLVFLSIVQAAAQPETFDARIRSLIGQMTVEEKITQLTIYNPAIPRIGLPHYSWQTECLHGLLDDSVTVFPSPIGLGATWNPALIFDIATAASDEGRIRNRQKGTGLSYWAPNLEIARDPRWGRLQETYSEDPYLVSRLGVAYVKGLQGNDKVYWKTVGSPKHFFAHSGPEPGRYIFNADVSERDMWESYLPAWQAIFTEAKAHGFMAAYNAVNKIPNAVNKNLITDLIRKKWGFEGYVVSDCGAIVFVVWGLGAAKSEPDAAAKAVLAGSDLECGIMYTDHLADALIEGLLTVEDIDSALYRLLWVRFKLGLFDPVDSVPFNKIPESKLNCRENIDLAYRAAQQSMVLLKNDKNTLPLRKNYDSILVIGPRVLGDNYGGYSGKAPYFISALDGIKKKVNSKTKVNYTQGCDIAGFNTRPLPSRFLRTYDGKQGLLGEYFNNKNLTGTPMLTRIDSAINFNWSENSPGAGINKDSFSVRWTGKIRVDSTAVYTLKLLTDDGVKVYFDSILVINNWADHGVIDRLTVVSMEAGRDYPIKVEYYDHMQYAVARLEIGTEDTDLYKVDSIAQYASKHDAIIFVGGLSTEYENEHLPLKIPGFLYGDRTSLDLPLVQSRLLMKLNETKKPLVFVMVNGSCLSINNINDSVPAILEMWYGSQEYGRALADILFGDYNPSGKLPITFYKSVNDLPDFKSYDMAGRTYRYFDKEVLYPFGYGLSYTKFGYKSMKVPAKDIEIGQADTIPVYFSIANEGKIDGDEIVQLYCRSLDSRFPRPLKWLAGFKRISIKQGKTVADSIKLSINYLRAYDTTIHDYYLEPGRYELQLAASSQDIRIVDTITLKNKPDSVVDLQSDEHFTIWPNPAGDIVHVKAKTILVGELKISVHNLAGERLDCKILQNSRPGEFIADVSHLSAGTYFVTIEDDISTFTYRIIINR